VYVNIFLFRWRGIRSTIGLSKGPHRKDGVRLGISDVVPDDGVASSRDRRMNATANCVTGCRPWRCRAVASASCHLKWTPRRRCVLADAVMQRPVGPSDAATVVAPSDARHMVAAAMDRRVDLSQTVARTPRPRGELCASGRDPGARLGRDRYRGGRRTRPSDPINHLLVVLGTCSRRPIRVVAANVCARKIATQSFS